MDFIQALKKDGEKHFCWLTTLGILNIVLGALAITFTGAATLVSMIYLGWLLCASGIASIVLGYRLRKAGGHTSMFVLGILGLVCGILILRNPVENALALTLVIAIFLFTSGVFRLGSCLVDDFEHKGWVALSGIASIFCAYEIYNNWPFSGAWVIGTFLGIDLLISGISQLRIGLAGRKLVKA